MDPQSTRSGNVEDYLTWCEFKDQVYDLMPQDSQRFGLVTQPGATPTGQQAYADKLIRLACIDLQLFIPTYRQRHETLYYPQDFVCDGAASVGTLPPQAKIEDVWYFKLDCHRRFVVERWDWERRFEMVHKGIKNLLGTDYVVLTAASLASIELVNRLLIASGERKRCALIAVDPNAHTFYLYPALLDGWIFELFWTGIKRKFRENELVPFDELAAAAVADHVRSAFAKEVDRDAQRSADFMADYKVKRLNLFTETKERGTLRS